MANKSTPHNNGSKKSKLTIRSAQDYAYDQASGSFDKICLTEILNADLHIATFGEEVYYKACYDVIADIWAFIGELECQDKVKLYSFSYKNFILATSSSVSEEEFEKVCRSIYKKFEYATSSEFKISAVSRFVIVLGGENMIPHALDVLRGSQNLQENFFVSRNSKDFIASRKNEINMFEVLSQAVEHNRIVPYFQGIHNNKTGKIDRYESLMRIYDAEGRVYVPSEFLDIAKKYKFYGKLSAEAIEKALTAFENRTEKLSLNISMYDIENTRFKKWFLKRLSEFSDPGRISLEFVETENLLNFQLLGDFIAKIQALGCSIALDDFGAGFATFITLTKIKPSVLKVDGAIIRNIAKQGESLMILKQICKMAEFFSADIVAEFVENEQLQEILQEHGIGFSQGYYFAKPIPMEEIERAEGKK